MAGIANGQNAPLTIELSNPTNNQVFGAPANIYVHARVADTNLVRTVQYFSGATSIGLVTNTTAVLVTNFSQGNPFPITWSNVTAGAYTLTAVVVDSAGNMATSAPVNITVTNPTVRPAVYIYSPTNGAVFPPPASLTIYARAVESSGTVASVQFFANNTSLGVVSNSSQMVFTNVSSEPLFPFAWSNVATGSYALKAVATDVTGNSATSSVVNITVTNAPTPIIPFIVSFWYPTNGQTFLAPATIGVHAMVTDSNVVETMQYFANGGSIGIVTNISGELLTNTSLGNPFFMSWSNVLAGSYALTAVATDNRGNTATSSVVNITVTNAPAPIIPFIVSFWYPTNGQTFLAPATIGVHAMVTDSNKIETMQYFANGGSIGIVTNSGGILLTNTSLGNPFFMSWSNVQAGDYTLTAVAMDSAGNTATSAPVNIFVVTNLPPVVNIYAPDPVAVVGTNFINVYTPTSPVTNYIGGTNTATFLVHRNGDTNTDLTVYYAIGGTASNGVDYVSLPGYVTIPAGRSYALIVIVPLYDTNSVSSNYDTVVLTLIPPPVVSNSPPAYTIGSPQSAGAVIMEDGYLPMLQPVIRSLNSSVVHVSLPATNGMNYCLEVSPDLVNWLPVCTNTVLKGSAHYVDPNGISSSSLFYRIVPVAAPASY